MQRTSEVQTSCSSDKNDSFSTVMKNDAIRYRRKGYGLVTALAMVIGYFFYFPQLLREVWPTYLSIASESTLYVFSILLLNIGVLLLANLMMVWIYKKKIPFFEKYRISSVQLVLIQKPWPWEEDPIKWSATLKKTLKSIAFNILVLQLSFLYLDTLSHFHIKFDLESFPCIHNCNSAIFTHMWQIFLFMIVEDFFFFLAHSALHQKCLYWIHKQHHEYNITVSLAAEYSHPLEFVLSNMIPTGLGFRLLSIYYPVHMSTVIMWIFIRVWETTDGHCGYEWSWSVFRLLPMSGSAEYHNFHHSHNVGNYASFFSIWDTIFGTNKYYFEYKNKKEREEYLNTLRLEYEAKKKKDCPIIMERSNDGQ